MQCLQKDEEKKSEIFTGLLVQLCSIAVWPECPEVWTKSTSLSNNTFRHVPTYYEAFSTYFSCFH